MSQPLAYGFEGGHAYAQYYKHSGKVTPVGVVSGVACGLIAAPLLAWAYAYGDSYIPLVYLNVLLAIGFGIAIGFAVAGTMRWGNVRNAPLTLTVTALVTFIAYYLCWAAWICVTFDRYSEGGRDFTFLDLLLHPRGMYLLAQLIDETGTWSIGRGSSNSNVSGVALLVVWAAEAIVVFGAAIMTAKAVGVDQPFCERCLRWSDKPAAVATLPAGDVTEAKRAIEARDWSYLAGAVATPARDDHFWSLLASRCATCEELHLLTLNDVRVTTKKGKVDVTTKALLKGLHVSDADVAEIRQAVQPPAPAEPAVATAADATAAEPIDLAGDAAR